MRRQFTLVTVIVAVVALTQPGTSGAAVRTCPASPSGWQPFEILGDPGDPAPDRGEDPLWDLVEDLAAVEGLSLQELAEAFGLEDVDAVYGFLLESLIGQDHNGDATICIKPVPLQQDVYPAYIFSILDNNARVRG
jgi:hypothetical protein